MYHCAECTLHGCISHDPEKMMRVCPTREAELQEKALALYQQPENHDIAYQSALVEGEGYGRLCRMEEIMDFARRMGYHKLGLVFCMGLRSEAATVSRILRANGFEVCSVICKNGGHPKAAIGVPDEKAVSGCAQETMCNPIGQALMMNEAGVEFNILLGLCVGHDTLALKYLSAPVTVLAVKDRVTGHNPLAPIYVADGYYKKKFFK